MKILLLLKAAKGKKDSYQEVVFSYCVSVRWDGKVGAVQEEGRGAG